MRAFTTATANMTGRKEVIIMGGSMTAGTVVTTAGWLTTGVTATGLTVLMTPPAPASTAVVAVCSSLGPAV